MKGDGTAQNYREIDRREGGVGWIAYPDETMQRASHAFAVDGEVYIVDPVDVPDLDELVGEFGEVAGVVALLDRHKRDAATVANRHDVPVYVPNWMTGVAEDLGARVERPGRELADTGVGIHKLVDNAFWQEAALTVDDGDGETLIVPESVGTAQYFLAAGERLGVHPMLRLKPPRDLRTFSPDRVLVGHGDGIHENATEALQSAVDQSRVRTPGLYAKNLKDLILG